ncbi:RHS repeat-associated core domain-containing protein [Catenulispora yoronensis]|uniref:RHS repeat-associated core domain-containing protein n=1 Tax=Catenulispora yoronensis TaxID=450799 RepID=UPI0031DF4463
MANDLAPFLDVLALATSWIPGVDVITAGLAEADNLIALAGTGMQIVGDGMQGHWGDALMGAGMLGATFLGGKAISKLGGKAFESMSSKFGKEAEGAENAVGTRARAAEGKTPATVEDDPVDVVSGWMLTGAVDLELPGVLPVLLRRAYASGYATGHLFGPGWSSTLDQRLSINEAGIHFVGDDSQRLDYPLPSGGQEVLPDRGSRWPLVWDRESDEIRISDPWSGAVRHFPVAHFDNEFAQIRDLTSITDRNGNRITILRDQDGSPTIIEHPGYRVAVDTVATAGGPRIEALRLLEHGGAEQGIVVRRFQYDAHGRLTGVVNSSGLPFIYEWDENDRITAWRDRSGYRYGYRYDAIGRVVQGEGRFLAGSFAYDSANRTTVHTNSLGHVTTFVYDEHGHVCSETDPLGHTTVTETDRYGRILAQADALGRATTYHRDSAGDVRRVVAPDGAVTEMDYNDHRRVVTAVEPDGAVWRREYDDRGNVLRRTDPAGAVTRFEYAPTGALAALTDPLGAVTRFGTDAAGLVVAVTDALGFTSRATRDSAGRIVASIDALGATTRYAWNHDGMPISRTDPDGATSQWRYDTAGRLVEAIDPIGAVTAFEPGPMGTLVARTGPDGARYTFAYDSELNLQRVVRPDGASWDYGYDPAGRLIAESDFIDRRLGYEWDAAGNPAARTNGAGQRITLECDAAGRVTTRRTPEGVYTYVYDTVGRLASATTPASALSYRRDSVGRVLAETVDGRTTHYDYDAVGRRVRRRTASAAESTWTYDSAGRPIGLTAGATRLDFMFDEAGQEIERIVAGGARLKRRFDVAGRPVAEDLIVGPVGAAGDEPGNVVATLSRTWSWRADGVPNEIHDTLRGTRRIVSDRAGRVGTVSAYDWTESYAYDSFGGLAASTDTRFDDAVVASRSSGSQGTPERRAGRVHHDYDAAGRLVRTIRRTLDGRRRTWTYTWNSQDQLIEAETPDHGVWRYSYDAVGRRTSKALVVENGLADQAQVRAVYSWDGPRLIEELTGDDALVTALTWDYDPGSVRPATQRRRTWANSENTAAVDEAFHAIITDLVGTPTELVGTDGRIAWHITSTLWGRTVSTSADDSVDCPLRFPGQYHDAETGLHYNLFRYYSPDLAEYLTPDPLGLAPSPHDHAYVTNPLIAIDPFGLYENPGSDAAGKQPPKEPVYENPGHHDPYGGPNAYIPSKAVITPDAEEQFARSVQVGDTRWTKIGTGKKAVYYRYFQHEDNVWHWSGSSIGRTLSGQDVKIPENHIPVDVRRS